MISHTFGGRLKVARGALAKFMADGPHVAAVGLEALQLGR